MKKPSICFIARNAYGVLAEVDTAHAGGIEVQVPMMARWLATKGFTVSVICWDHGYEDGVVHHGVTVRKLCRKDEGLPVLRLFYPRWSSLVDALKRVDADVYYFNGADIALGQLVLWAQSHHKKVIFSAASDADCVKDVNHIIPLRERILYRYGLRRCERVICQSEQQKGLLQTEMGVDAEVFRMPAIGFKPETGIEQEASSDKRVLWVGRLQHEKRLELLLDLAEMCPEFTFDVVGDANESNSGEYVDALRVRASKINNVVMHGRVDHASMSRFYTGALVLCSTSAFEGFPNVYLEAWSMGVPVLSTFDPDGLIKNKELGYFAESVAEMRDRLHALLDVRVWNDASNRVKDYFQNTHSVDVAMPLFERLFDDVAQG